MNKKITLKEEENVTLSEMEECQICVKCYSKTSNILILSCDHNLCLKCGSEVYLNQGSTNYSKANVFLIQKFRCPKCKFITILDKDSINELKYIINSKCIKNSNRIILEDNKIEKKDY